ncbi:helix-turn-helix domain-containing protein [Streptomyces sp. NPDC005538]|uniref:helix-turn-helix domain-containing protein n=1 Tax=unclassified Streptomyces TaxID=2593676 RepID=UPI0033A782AD
MNGAAVGDKLPDWNTKPQLQALRHLLATLPGPEVVPVVREATPVPRTAKQIKGEQAQRLITTYEDGAGLAELSRQFGISRQTVSSILKRHGIVPRWSRRITDEEVDEAARLYEQGLSLARVGQRFNTTDDTIRRHLLKRGVKMRDTHGRD